MNMYFNVYCLVVDILKVFFLIYLIYFIFNVFEKISKKNIEKIYISILYISQHLMNKFIKNMVFLPSMQLTHKTVLFLPI